MRRRIRSKYWWAAFAIFVLGVAISVEVVGKVFFVNRTQSMPTGIYIRRGRGDFEVGDIVVFRQSGNSTNLIKYVSAVVPAEFCVDEDAMFWIDGYPTAQLNIEKYPNSIVDQSYCRRLHTGEILVLGDHPNSYDSRYFGPVKIKDVIAQVELLWQFK